ncbi:MAG: aminotransferase, partial [Lachnospiraceae bacterium]|nr:aminotransferase [Lachnospiraceae bacterium]
MKAYKAMTRKELTAQKAELEKQFADARGKGLQLDMSRGKPEPAQLDMGMGLLDALNSSSDMMSME